MANKPNPKPNSPDNLAHLPTRCVAENCSQKATRMNFCKEHFVWFKEGLVTKEGHTPSDFDKKYTAFQARRKSAA